MTHPDPVRAIAHWKWSGRHRTADSEDHDYVGSTFRSRATAPENDTQPLQDNKMTSFVCDLCLFLVLLYISPLK